MTPLHADRAGPSAASVLRLLALAVAIGDAAFLSLFALDAFSPELPFGRQLLGFGMHLLPSLALVALAALSWRFPGLGGSLLVALALLPFAALSNPVGVNVMLALPVLLAGGLFLASAWLRRPR